MPALHPRRDQHWQQAHRHALASPGLRVCLPRAASAAAAADACVALPTRGQRGARPAAIIMARSLPLLLLLSLCALVLSSLHPPLRALALDPVPSWFATPRDPVTRLDARPAPAHFSFHLTSGLVGSVRYSPCLDSPAIPDGLVDVRISIPQAGEDMSGCTALSATGAGGQAHAGAVLLLLGGACSVAKQFEVAQAVGAVAWINTLRSEGVELWTAFGANTPEGNKPQNIPYFLVSYHDGLVLANWILSNPGTPLLATIPGAGTLLPSEAAIVRAIYSKINASVPGGWRGDCVDAYCGFLRPFQDVILRPDLDYCQHRVGAIWCVEGRVVGFFLKAKNHLANLPANTFDWDLLGQLSELSLLHSASSPMAAFGAGLCRLHKLGVLVANGMYARALPNCFHLMPQFIFARLDTNVLTEFPTSAFNGSCPQLSYFRLASTAGGASAGLVPPDTFSPARTPLLAALVLNSAGLRGPLPDLRGFQWLRLVQLQNNAFTNDSRVSPEENANYLDNLPVLSDLQLTSNALRMPLPTLQGAVQLSNLQLAQNEFYGRLPASWFGLSSLTTLVANRNAIRAPINSVGALSSLRTLDLSRNQIESEMGDPAVDGVEPRNFDYWFAKSLPSTLERVLLSHNQLRGVFGYGIVMPAGLKIIDLAHNQIESFGTALFSLTALAQLDMSYNRLDGSLPVQTSPPSSLTLLNLGGNPQLRMDALPPYLAIETLSEVKAVGTSFVCSGIVSKGASILVTIDSTFHSYKYCECDASFFGMAPDCVSIPDSAVVGAAPFLPATPSAGDGGGGGTLLPVSPLQLSDRDLVSYAANSSLRLSDDVYGSRRQTTGLNTRWQLSSQQIMGHAHSKVIALLLYVNRQQFTGATNVLSVTSGDLSAQLQQRPYDFFLRGDDDERLDSATTFAASVGADRFGAAHTALFRVQVLDTDAVVQFQSRATAHAHFEMDYFFSDQCPPLYEANPAFAPGVAHDLPSCLPLALCSPALLSWTKSACDAATLTQTVQYSYSASCLADPSGAHSLPGPEETVCEFAHTGHYSSQLLLVLVCVLCAAIVALGAAMLLQSSSRSRSPWLIRRFLGEFSSGAMLGLLLLAATYFATLGEVTPTKCAARLHLLLVGFALLGTSIGVSLHKRRSALQLPFFNPHSRALAIQLWSVIGAFTLLNVVPLAIDQHLSGSSLSPSTWRLDGGASLQVSVCPSPSLWVSLVLLVVNLAWLLPTLLLNIQVLFLATLSRDRLSAQLAATKAAHRAQKDGAGAGASGGKQKQKLVQQMSATKAAMLGVMQAKSVLFALAGALVALLLLLAVLFFLAETSPAAASQGVGVLALLTAVLVLLPLFAHSFHHFVRRNAANATAAVERKFVDTTSTGARASSGGKGDGGSADACGPAPSPSPSHARDVSVHSGREESSTLSFSMTRSSGHSVTGGGLGGSGHPYLETMRERDAWSQLTADPTGANLFDASHTNRSSFDAVVSILQDPLALAHLRKFAQQSFQSDSIDFIIRVQEFIRAINSAPMAGQVGGVYGSGGVVALASSASSTDGAVSAASPAPNSFGRILSDLRAVYTQFIRPGAPDEVNLSNERRDSVRNALLLLHNDAVRLLTGQAMLAASPTEKDVLLPQRHARTVTADAATPTLKHVATPIKHAQQPQQPAPLRAGESASGVTEVEQLPGSCAQEAPPAASPGTPSHLAMQGWPATVRVESDSHTRMASGVMAEHAAPGASAAAAGPASAAAAAGPAALTSPTALPASPSIRSSLRPSPLLLSSAPCASASVQLSSWSASEFESELLRVSGLPATSLLTLAPLSFCGLAIEAWRDVSLEVVTLISHNTWTRFQDSQQARQANAQLAFCDNFDAFSAQDQHAILRRIRLQFEDAHDQAAWQAEAPAAEGAHAVAVGHSA